MNPRFVFLIIIVVLLVLIMILTIVVQSKRRRVIVTLPPPHPALIPVAVPHPAPAVVATTHDDDHDDHHHTPSPDRNGHVNWWVIAFFILGVLFILSIHILTDKAIEKNLIPKKERQKSSDGRYYEKILIYQDTITHAMSFDNLSKAAYVYSIGGVDISYIKDSNGDWHTISYPGAKTFEENTPVPGPARRASSPLIVRPQDDYAIIQVYDIRY